MPQREFRQIPLQGHHLLRSLAEVELADVAVTRQFITQGNLAENPKAYLFLMDYEHRRRVKIWGEAHVVEGDEELQKKLMPQDYKARAEQVILFKVAAWDVNCSQHIPQRFEVEDVAHAIAQRDQKIAALQAEIERLHEEKEAKAYGLNPS